MGNYGVSNIPGRISRIAKSYLDNVRDRIDAELTERERALAELTDTGSATTPTRGTNEEVRGADEPLTYGDNSDDLMRRAQEKINAARRDLDARRDIAPTLDGQPLPTSERTMTNTESNEDPNARDYRVLGVAPGGDLAQVQSAYEKLSRRCDPRRFPDGSQEQKDAERILERVNVSYEALRKRLDPTENRFGKLEF